MIQSVCRSTCTKLRHTHTHTHTRGALGRAEERLEQEENDFLFFDSRAPRVGAAFSAAPWTPTPASAAAAAGAAASASAGGEEAAGRRHQQQQQRLLRQQQESRASGGGGGGGGGGGEGTAFAPGVLDRFVKHVLGQNRQASTAHDYRTKADEFVGAWLRQLPAAARPLGSVSTEEEVRCCRLASFCFFRWG